MKNTQSATRHDLCKTIPMNQDLIDWKLAKREVRRLREQIARAKARGDRRMMRYLRYVLYTSPSAKLLRLR